MVAKFERLGTVSDDYEARSQVNRSIRTPESIKEVNEITEENPSISIRKLSQRVGISTASVWRIVKKDLEKFPYKIQVFQQIDVRKIH